jgi:hypothetical protein
LKRRNVVSRLPSPLGFSVLCSVLDGQLLVFAKVRLADLVYMPKGTANRQTQLL